MKIIKEEIEQELSNEIKDDQYKDDTEKAKEEAEKLIDPIERKNEKIFLGATKQPEPKDPEEPKATLDESLFEDINYSIEDIKRWVFESLDNMLEGNGGVEDNLAIVMHSMVNEYNPDWLSYYTSENIKKTRESYINALMKDLFANAPMDFEGGDVKESLKEAVDKDDVAKLKDLTLKAKKANKERLLTLKQVKVFNNRALNQIIDTADTKEEYDEICDIVDNYIQAVKSLNVSYGSIENALSEYPDIKDESLEEGVIKKNKLSYKGRPIDVMNTNELRDVYHELSGDKKGLYGTSKDVIYKKVADLLRKQKNESLSEDFNYIKITDIDWDTDGEDIDDLPTTETLPIADITDINDSELTEEEIADWLSDTYGWLVNGFNYEVDYDYMFDESLNEDMKDDDFLSLVIEWIMEHETAAQDFVNFFRLTSVADPYEEFITPQHLHKVGASLEDVLGWISEHPLLADDFERYFNISLDEECSKKELDEAEYGNKGSNRWQSLSNKQSREDKEFEKGLFARVDNELTAQAGPYELKAPKGRRYLNTGLDDKGILVYAPSVEELEHAKNVAKHFGLKCEINSVPGNQGTKTAYKAVIIIPEDLYEETPEETKARLENK